MTRDIDLLFPPLLQYFSTDQAHLDLRWTRYQADHSTATTPKKGLSRAFWNQLMKARHEDLPLANAPLQSCQVMTAGIRALNRLGTSGRFCVDLPADEAGYQQAMFEMFLLGQFENAADVAVIALEQEGRTPGRNHDLVLDVDNVNVHIEAKWRDDDQFGDVSPQTFAYLKGRLKASAPLPGMLVRLGKPILSPNEAVTAAVLIDETVLWRRNYLENRSSAPSCGEGIHVEHFSIAGTSVAYVPTKDEFWYESALVSGVLMDEGGLFAVVPPVASRSELGTTQDGYTANPHRLAIRSLCEKALTQLPDAISPTHQNIICVGMEDMDDFAVQLAVLGHTHLLDSAGNPVVGLFSEPGWDTVSGVLVVEVQRVPAFALWPTPRAEWIGNPNADPPPSKELVAKLVKSITAEISWPSS